MSVVGHQDFWLAGARVYIRKEAAVGANPNPVLDLGVIQQANPTVTPNLLELFDSDGGSRAKVDEEVSTIQESYEVQTNNLNMENLALLFLADSPSAFTAPGSERTDQYYSNEGHLLQLEDSSGLARVGLDGIWGVFSGVVGVHSEPTGISNMDASAQTMVIGTSDLTAIYSAAAQFIVTGVNLTNFKNGGTYKVASSSFGGGVTTVTVDTTQKSIVADESFSGGDGSTIYANGGSVYIPGTDWEVASLDRGLVRNIEGGAIGSANVNVSHKEGTYSGTRLINPQKVGAVRAKAFIHYSRDNFARASIREVDVSIVPSGSNFQNTAFSDMTLTINVLNDLTSSTPAGRILHYKGAVPPKSSVQESTPQGD